MPEWYTCPKCEHVLNVDKKICDKCGYQVTDDQIMQQKNKKRERIAKENDKAYMAIVLIILILVGGVSYFIMKPNPPKSPEARPSSYKHKPTGAIPYQFVKLFVKDRLKSPKTADFAPFSDAKCELLPDGKTWKIYSYVDSQNSFGAMIRTGFYVKLIEDGPNWKLLDIVFMNQ